MLKKHLIQMVAILVCFTMQCGFIPANTAKADTVTSIGTQIANGGFESSLGGYPGGSISNWSNYTSIDSGNSMIVTNDSPLSGSNSLKMYRAASTKAMGLMSDKIPVTPGTSYTVNIEGYINSGAVQVYLKFFNSSGGAMTSYDKWSSLKNITGATPAWTKISVQNIAPVGSAKAQIWLYSSGSNACDAYVDNVTFDDTSSYVKQLLPNSFTAVDGTDSNLLTYLNNINGMKDTGVTLSLQSSNANVANDGTISYTGSEVTGNVTVNIRLADGTVANKYIAVTVTVSSVTAEEANADIAAAKQLLPDSFTAVEGTDSNLLTYLNNISGMGDTGVTLSLQSSNANVADGGTVRYTDSEVTGNVKVKINMINGTEDSKTIVVTVPATTAIQDNTDIEAAKQQLPDSFTAVEGKDTNLLTDLNDISGMLDTGVTLTLQSSNSNVSNDGTISYTGNQVTVNVTVKINKRNGTEASKTIAVTIPATTVKEGTLVSNGGFESPLNNGNIPNWSLFSPLPTGYSIDVTSDNPFAGSNSLKLVDTGNSSIGLSSDKISVEPGKNYSVTSKVYTTSGVATVYLKFLGSNGQEVGSVSQPAKFAGSAAWTTINVTGVAPETATKAYILLYSGSTNTCLAYFDDVTFDKGPDPIKLPFNYGAPIKIGPAVLASQTAAATIGNGEVYFATNGSPSTFYVLDATTGAVKFSQAIPGSDVIWAVTVGSDGDAYFSGTNDGILYRYVPSENKIENLGTNPSDKWVWDMDASSDGKIYGATYPNSKVFEYDIASGIFKDLGSAYPGQQYARGLGVTDKYIYAGIGGTQAHLMKIDRTTGVSTEITLPYTGQNSMVSNIWSYGGRLFVADGTILCVLDENTDQLLKEVNYTDPQAFDGMISAPSPYDSNIIYYRNKNTGELWTYNLSTNEVAPVTPTVSLPSSSSVKSAQWVTLTSGNKKGKQVLAMLFSQTEYGLYDPGDNSFEIIYPDVAKQGVAMQSLETGLDGRIYLGGYQAAMSIYDPVLKKFDVQAPGPSQIEGMGSFNGKMYFGTYGGAVIWQYDLSQPYVPNVNPDVVYNMGNDQSRPFAFTSGDNKLFIGTIADYGLLDGGLTVYDAAKGTWTTYKNVVQNQSVIGLAYKNGIVYGGTTLWGGAGSVPTATDAKMFKWDVAKGEKISEFEPVVPGIKAPQMIGSLSFGPDGLLWGIECGLDNTGATVFALFAIDPTTDTVVKSTVYKNGSKASSWRPFFMEWGDDGLLYTTIGRQLVVFDPNTLQYKQLVSGYVHLMTLGPDGSIYYSNASDSYLYELPVPLTEAGISSNPSNMTEFETAQLRVNGTLANGKTANLAGAAIQYTSGNPDVLSIKDGVMSALKPGTADVWCDVTLDGTMVESDKITIQVLPLVIGFATGDSATSVTQNVYLNATGANGTTITWSSDTPSVISASGTVTRLPASSGDATVTLTATIGKDAATDTKTFTLKVLKLPDTTPPVTAAVVAGTIGANGWYTSDASVSLNATDDASGVASTEYTLTVVQSVYGQQSTDGFVPYSLPLVLSEGIYQVQYRSTDRAGNVEAAKTVTVKSDKTAPTFALTANGSPLSDGAGFVDSQTVTLALQTSDTLSGIATQTVTVDSNLYTGSALDWAGQLGTHVIQITVTDQAGNVKQATLHVTVTTSTDALQLLLTRFTASGDLSVSLQKQLRNSLNQALEQLSKGHKDQAVKHMQEFLKHLDKKGSDISDHSSQVLTADANAIIAAWSN